MTRMLKQPILHIVVLLSFLIINSCMWYGPAPGKGYKAEAFYTKAKPLISALESYHQDNGTYPNHIEQLSPTYLKQLQWGENKSSRYMKTGNTYQLWFSYTGPGMNTCIFVSVNKKWQCSGFI